MYVQKAHLAATLSNPCKTAQVMPHTFGTHYIFFFFFKESATSYKLSKLRAKHVAFVSFYSSPRVFFLTGLIDVES
jgi:hypothetical protein